MSVSMEERRGFAFAPAHLTAFFRTFLPGDTMDKTGSAGAGFCLSKGAYTEVNVELEEGKERERIIIYINGTKREAKVTRKAVNFMLEHARRMQWENLLDGGLKITIKTRLELPEKSGWGMSGAGALSTVLALREALQLPLTLYETARFAHYAELSSLTGLGDVVAQCNGGLEIRRTPGFPPYGFVDRIPVNEELRIVCLTLSDPLPTPEILQDHEKRKKIDVAGKRALREILAHPTYKKFIELSMDFTMFTGLASTEIIRAIKLSRGLGKGGMAMLGNSAFFIGDTERLSSTLSELGRVDICTVDLMGARPVKGREVKEDEA